MILAQWNRMGYCSILWWWNRDFTHGYGINPWWTQKKDSTQLSEVESPSRMNKILICLPQDFTQHFSQSLDCDKWPAALESRNICLQDHDDHNMLEIEQTSCGCNELDTKLCSPETKKNMNDNHLLVFIDHILMCWVQYLSICNKYGVSSQAAVSLSA